MDTLFPDEPAGPRAPAPLAERMRPRTFDEFVGQEELLAPGKPLREAIERDLLQSIIFWGPPGTGKTTVARIIADMTKARFVSFSAVLAGIKEIREVMTEAQRIRRSTGRRTIVFIDEIHRFNKAQQDAFLPRVEAGDIILIRATTENPLFEVNAALLSRSKVFVLHGLTEAQIVALLERAVKERQRGLGREPIETEPGLLERLARYSKRDAVYTAYGAAAEAALRQVADPVPLHIRNAPTRLMKERNCGKGYRYAHDEAEGVADMDCLPESLQGKKYYQPTDRGFEAEIR